ncbi:uncharacterized protein AB9W97_015761 isoform 2-T2 [Spinachia spinachia]
MAARHADQQRPAGDPTETVATSPAGSIPTGHVFMPLSAGSGAGAQAKVVGPISALHEGKQEETDQRHPGASSSGETDDDVVVQANVRSKFLLLNRDSAGGRTVPPTEGSSPLEDDTTLNVEDKRNAVQADGDYTRQIPEDALQIKTTQEISSEAPETTSPLTLHSKKDDAVGRAVEEPPDSNAQDAREGDLVGGGGEEPPDSNAQDAREGDLVGGGGEEPPDSNTQDAGEGDLVGGGGEEPPDSNTQDAGEGDLVGGGGEEPPDSNTQDADAEEADESSSEKEEEVTKGYTISPHQGEYVETIGPTPKETGDVAPALVIGHRGGTTLWIAGGLLALVIAFLWQHLLQTQLPPQKDEVRQIDIFLGHLEKVKTEFPHQRAELWARSKIHLVRHLRTARPTEPVSLILTAGRGGERTMRCLAQRLASAFSSSLNASVLHIDGASKASGDSDQVKLDIDSKLQGAFEGDKPVAVIHRFEELPPGATLIFYRYCDHENAAYKKTCMIFTVLLGEEDEIPAETHLTTVEEMVDDHLQKKFLAEGHPVSFDRMDLDKYGGLWSRISHLILPVAAEQSIEHGGC